jgi:hypothetical protein
LLDICWLGCEPVGVLQRGFNFGAETVVMSWFQSLPSKMRFAPWLEAFVYLYFSFFDHMTLDKFDAETVL